MFGKWLLKETQRKSQQNNSANQNNERPQTVNTVFYVGQRESHNAWPITHTVLINFLHSSKYLPQLPTSFLKKNLFVCFLYITEVLDKIYLNGLSPFPFPCYFFYFMSLFAFCHNMCVCARARKHKSHRTTCGSCFSSTMWNPEIEFRQAVLVASTFIQRATLLPTPLFDCQVTFSEHHLNM